MDANVAKFDAYLKEHGISHEMKEFSMNVGSAMSGPYPADQTVKTIILIDKKNDTYAALLRGDDRISMSRMGFNLKLDGLRLAKQQEVLERTGFPVGGVPPLGFKAHFIIDVKVEEMPFCWAGGGSDKTLIKLNPKDIITHTGGKVVRITG